MARSMTLIVLQKHDAVMSAGAPGAADSNGRPYRIGARLQLVSAMLRPIFTAVRSFRLHCCTPRDCECSLFTICRSRLDDVLQLRPQ